MIFVPSDASNEELLSIVRAWIDVLSHEDYQAVAEALGYALSYGRPPAECIEMEIKRYRSPRYYPGVERFAVSDWRTAHGGNPEPFQLIRWYEPNSIRIRSTVELDLPINGQWSDLRADFVIFENQNQNPNEDLVLTLEQISCQEQMQREFDEADVNVPFVKH